MIDYSSTQDMLKALQLQFPDLADFLIKKAMKKHTSEKMICDYLLQILPF